jgi:hypothetical protein
MTSLLRCQRGDNYKLTLSFNDRVNDGEDAAAAPEDESCPARNAASSASDDENGSARRDANADVELYCQVNRHRIRTPRNRDERNRQHEERVRHGELPFWSVMRHDW